MIELVRLRIADGTWAEFEENWKLQCDGFGEDFEYYQTGPLSYVRDLAETEQKCAAAYAMKVRTDYAAMCQLNVGRLPHTMGVTLRVRMMYMSPYFDYGDYDISEYALTLSRLVNEVVKISNGEMGSDHIKFHLRSPADRQFFAMYGQILDESNLFESVKTAGTWLYITKK